LLKKYVLEPIAIKILNFKSVLTYNLNAIKIYKRE